VTCDFRTGQEWGNHRGRPCSTGTSLG
jgi:hypothetical protein